MAEFEIDLVRATFPILGSFSVGNLYGWAGFAPAVRAQFDASHSETSMIFSIALVCFTLGVLAGPAIFARLFRGHRLAGIAAIAALCLLLSNSSPAFGLFVLSYGAGFGFVAGAFYNCAIVAMSRTRISGVLVPVSVAAFGLGGAAFGASSLWLTQMGFGLWSNLPAFACLLVVAVGSIAFGLDEREQPRAVVDTLFSKPDRQLVVLWTVFAFGSFPGLIVLGMATEFLPEGSDAVGLAGLAVFLAALGNTSGRLAAGAVAPLYGPSRGIVLSLVMSLLAVAALIVLPGATSALAALACVALAYGHLAANMPLLVRDRVAPQDFPGSFGWVFTGWGFAGLVGPWGAGWLLDQSGDLTVALGVCATLTFGALWLMLRAVPIARPNPGK